MNLLKRTSPAPHQGAASFGGRLTPSPHYTSGSTPGSPLTTQQPRGQAPSSLLLQMGGENSAFKALVPSSAAALMDARVAGGYATDSDEEINVNDESDAEEGASGRKSGASTPVEVVDPPGKDSAQPLQLTMHNRD